MQDYGYYGPGSATWKIASETVITLGGTRAVLMQIAHPLVAMGVSEHSSYMTDPLGRTEHTFVLGQLLTFGSVASARDAARTINRLHTHVHGNLYDSAGAYSVGTPYRARDPELLLWVHATLIDTILFTYLMFIGPLSLHEQEQYYQESKTLAYLLGLSPAHMPATVQDLHQYVNDMVHSNRLAATPQSRQLAQQVLFPRIPSILRPFLHLNAQLTTALLPQPIREIYGLEWNACQQRAFELSARGLRTIVPRLPSSLRVLPITQRLMRQGNLSKRMSARR
ncbi:MAG: DUF2236 domain-containing protein [Chloroflexi bacterium]|nr:MAG: DUF2236 domain-containing protein [Chloroflexota bacterium]